MCFLVELFKELELYHGNDVNKRVLYLKIFALIT